MAQKRFWNWRDDDYTLDMNHKDLGIIEAGLYRGFDRDNSSAGLNLVLSHLVNGVQKTKLDGTATPFTGIWLTKQGAVITEDAALTIPVTANATGNPRIDLVVGTHEYAQTVGGLVATYSIIQGTPAASPVAPALTFPTKQIILGTLSVPANTSSVTGMTYTKSKMPNLGNAPTLALALTDLTDVTVTNATDGDILVKNGAGDWINMNAKTFIQNLQLNMAQRFGLSYSQQTVSFMSGGSPVMGFIDDLVGVTGGYAFSFNANVINYDVGDGVFAAYQIPNIWGASAVKWAANHPNGTVVYMIISPNLQMNIQLGASSPPTGFCPIVSMTKSGTYSGGGVLLKFTKYNHKTAPLFGYQDYWLMEEYKDYDSYIDSIQTQINTLTTNLNLLDLTLQQEMANVNQDLSSLFSQMTTKANLTASNLTSANVTQWLQKLGTRKIWEVGSVHLNDINGNWTANYIPFMNAVPSAYNHFGQSGTGYPSSNNVKGGTFMVFAEIVRYTGASCTGSGSGNPPWFGYSNGSILGTAFNMRGSVWHPANGGFYFVTWDDNNNGYLNDLIVNYVVILLPQ